MRETRRGFVMGLAAAASVLAPDIFATRGGLALAQVQRPRFPKPPQPADQRGNDTNDGARDPNALKRAALAKNEKEFREGVERLYQMSGELREELQKTMATDVLSVRMYKAMEEIEKLAKQLKNKAKGG